MDNIVSISEFDGFDWDDGNVQKNWITHSVTPEIRAYGENVDRVRLHVMHTEVHF